MSLDDIVAASRAEKGKSGGKATKDKPKKAAPYEKPKQERPPKKERPPPAEAPPSESVYVGNLPFSLELATLEERMTSVGQCTVEMKKRGNKPAGFAIVTFASIEAATTAVETLADTEIEGRKLLVRFARAESGNAKDEDAASKKEAEPSNSVYVGNLPFTIEQSVLEAHMATVGTCTVDLKARKNGKPAGFAIVTFESVAAATSAVDTLAETELEGRKLLIRFAKSSS